jgi:glycosyltransferase involved in cell wall biosynthesis
VRQLGGTNIHVIPNGVDPARFDPTPKQGGRFTVGFVGTLKPWHGLPVLVEAAKLARMCGVDLNLLIVGDGPARELLEADIAKAGLHKIAKLTGAVQPQDIPPLIARMDVAVAPYPAMPDFYFSPLKVMEYMAAGRAIVASRIGDIGSLLIDGKTGLLVKAGDPAALAGAIVRLSHDRALCVRLGSNARAIVERKHSWSGVADQILNLAHVTKRKAA